MEGQWEAPTNWYWSDSWSKASLLLGSETTGERGREVSQADREKRRPSHICLHQPKVCLLTCLDQSFSSCCINLTPSVTWVNS